MSRPSASFTTATLALVLASFPPHLAAQPRAVEPSTRTVDSASSEAPSPRSSERSEVTSSEVTSSEVTSSGASSSGDGSRAWVAPEGFVLRSADGGSSLRVGGLLQLQYAHTWGAEPSDAFVVRRARLGISGSLVRPELRYLLVVELAGREIQLLFASVEHVFVPERLSLVVGRFKRPFSRSFLTLASRLAMADRPITIGRDAFGDDLDTGVMLRGISPLEYGLGLFVGGRPDGVEPLLAARIGYRSSALDDSESDLDGGALRVGVAAAALVDPDPDEDDARVRATIDFALKARGLSLTSAFFVATRASGARWSSRRLDAFGHHTQLAYVLGGRVEPVLRHALRVPSGGEPLHELAGGLNVYLLGRALVLQSSISVRLSRAGEPGPDVRFQSQLGLAL
jgi:hypothetical protein